MRLDPADHPIDNLSENCIRLDVPTIQEIASFLDPGGATTAALLLFTT
jgi:hypothetical protein